MIREKSDEQVLAEAIDWVDEDNAWLIGSYGEDARSRVRTTLPEFPLDVARRILEALRRQ